jgi:hypothetical protein
MLAAELTRLTVLVSNSTAVAHKTAVPMMARTYDIAIGHLLGFFLAAMEIR